MLFKTFKRTVLSAMSLAIFALPAFAADLAGTKDPAFMQRFKGSDIVDQFSLPYTQYKLNQYRYWMDEPNPKITKIEGQLTRTVYHLTGGHTGIEILRNYEQSLASKGFKVTYELPIGTPMASNNYVNGVYYQNFQQGVAWAKGMFWDNVLQEANGVIEQGTVDGKPTTVVVAVATFGSDYDTSFLGRESKKLHMARGDIGIIVDVVTGTAIQNQMVTVKAADIADALSSKGFIDLYGIYFDTDKTDIKPESSATLDEVASLMRIDRSLKLEVSGHTDNTGDKAHNLKLSQGRADAVVKMLTTKYGIDAKRLIAKGYGDTKPVAPNTTDAGKAKNRRVELRKL